MADKVQVVTPAEPGSRFASGAFDHAVGTVCPLTLHDQFIGECTLLSVQVAADGTYVTLSLELPDGVVPPNPAGSRTSFQEGTVR